MADRKYPLFYRRWWDRALNCHDSCKVGDKSCIFCYAPQRAGRLQTKDQVEPPPRHNQVKARAVDLERENEGATRRTIIIGRSPWMGGLPRTAIGSG